MKAHMSELSLSPEEVQARKELIQYLRSKLKNRNYTDNCTNIFDTQDYTGIDLEVYGSYAAGLSTNSSDLDLRINDFYTYRYLNLQKIADNLEFMPQEAETQDSKQKLDWWTGPESKKKRSRLVVTEYLRQAKVPILKMLDRKTQINIDISQGSSCVNIRHIQICRRAQTHYPNLKTLVLCLKAYLAKCSCNQSYQGGISSFLLFYMVLAFYQNYDQLYKDHVIDAPEIVKFLQFYTFFNQQDLGIQIDLSELFPDEYYNNKFQKITSNPITTKNPLIEMDCLYIKDPIGKIYYSDPSEYHLYRDNAGGSAFEYVSRVKPQFANSFHNIMSGNYNIPNQINDKTHETQSIDYHRFMEDEKVDDEIVLPKSKKQQELSPQLKNEPVNNEKSPLEMNVEEIEQQIIENWTIEPNEYKQDNLNQDLNDVNMLQENQHIVEEHIETESLKSNQNNSPNIIEQDFQQKDKQDIDIVEIDLDQISKTVNESKKKEKHHHKNSRQKYSEKKYKKEKPLLTSSKSSKSKKFTQKMAKDIIAIRKKQIYDLEIKMANKKENSKHFKKSLFKEILDTLEIVKSPSKRL